MPKYVTCQNKIKSIGPQILWLAQFMYCARFLDFTARYCHCELSLIKMKLLHQRFGIYMFILSAVLWILSWIFVTCLNLAAARQVRDQSNHPVQIFGSHSFHQVFRIRGEFLRAVLRQDIAWYDTNTSTDFASRLTE